MKNHMWTKCAILTLEKNRTRTIPKGWMQIQRQAFEK